MAAAITDKFTGAYNSANPNIARVTVTRTAGAASLSCDNLAGWPTATAVHFSTYKLNTSNAVVAGSQIDWKGIVSGNTIGTLTRKAGATDAGSAIGDVVEMNPTGSWEQDLMDGITAQHNQDGTHGAVTATSVSAPTLTATTSVTENGATLAAVRAEQTFDYVASGLVWSGDAYGSTLAASMTSGVVYINGQRGAISAVTARAFTASKDTYIDILNTAGVFTVVYTEVANNAASPALAANSLRIGIIVSAANIAAVGSVNQGQETKVLPIASSVPYAVTDSLGNLICPRDPNRKILGYRQITANATIASATLTDITGLSVPVIVPTGRKVRVRAFASYIQGSATVPFVSFVIAEGATVLQLALTNTTGTSGNASANPEYVTSPSAGLHTYKAQGAASTGNAVFQANATPTVSTGGPAYILVELV